MSSARVAAVTDLRVRADSIERARTRRFLGAQTTIVIAMAGLFVAAMAIGALPDGPTYYRGMAMCAVVLSITLGGWVVYRRGEATTSLVTGMLYADSVIGLVGFYLLGEFETTNVSTVALLVIMAPLFGVKRHAYGIATVQTFLYGMLLMAREYELLPYGWVFPREAFEATLGQYETFITDSIAGFMILVYGAALLAGEASLGVLTSNEELGAEVDKATERLALANLSLHQQNEALEHFNAALSHDLGSPLQSASLRTELLLTEPPGLTPDQAELVTEIRGSIERMGALTRELYKLSTLGPRMDSRAEVDPALLVVQVQKDLHQKMLTAGARLELRGPFPGVYCNEALIREVLQNLIENAIKYGGADSPRILVEPAEGVEGRVAIAVEDDGPGIPERDRARIFRPFVQLRSDRDGGGRGAGLAIVQRIVTAHGGDVRVDAGRELGGARFVLELPAARGPGVRTLG